MDASASTSERFSREFEDAMDTLGEELRQAVAYVEAVIVPQVRRESAGALRVLAGHLERLADKLDPDGKRDF